MSATATTDLTVLLRAWSAGDGEATDRLIALVYEELRRQATRYLARERADHTLRPRAQFFAVAATVMRRLLVDYARQHGASKRGAWAHTVSLEDGEQISVSAVPDLDVIAVNDALVELAAVDPLRARMIELRFFAGLTTDETAEALGVSAATVTRGWRLARAWLHYRLTHGSAPREQDARTSVET